MVFAQASADSHDWYTGCPGRNDAAEAHRTAQRASFQAATTSDLVRRSLIDQPTIRREKTS